MSQQTTFHWYACMLDDHYERLLIYVTVRSSPEDLHAAHPISLTQRRRLGTVKSTTRPPAAPPLLRLANLHPWSHSNQRFTLGQNTRNRHRSQHPLLESDRTTHTMQKLRKHRHSRRDVGFQRCHSAKSVQQTQEPRRCWREMPARPVLRGPREEPVHRSAGAEAARSS